MDGARNGGASNGNAGPSPVERHRIQGIKDWHPNDRRIHRIGRQRQGKKLLVQSHAFAIYILLTVRRYTVNPQIAPP